MALWAIFAVALLFDHVSSNTINDDSELTELKSVITKLSDRLSHFEGHIGDVSTSMQAQNENLNVTIARLSTRIEEKIDHAVDSLSTLICEPDPCLNNGKCLPVRNDIGKFGYECECFYGFSGDNCQYMPETYSGHDIRSLTDDCPGQGLYVFNEENKDETKEIVISPYVNYMDCWWYISNTLDTGHLELSFKDFKSEGSSKGFIDYLLVLKGSSTSSPQLHHLSSALGAKKITWTDSFVSIYWRTDASSNFSPMTGYLRYRP